MKKIIAALAVIGLLGGSLAACNGTTTTTLPASMVAIIDDVQVLATEACAFVPTAETIVAIITAGTAAAPMAIAAAICKVVTALPLATAQHNMAARTLVYPGTNVVITGHFVTKQ